MSSKNAKPPLSNFEWQIMDQVWTQSQASAREVLDSLPAEHQRAYTTIQTYLERLVDKGYLEKNKVGLVNFYAPIIPRKNMVTSETRRFVDQVFGGSMSQLAAYLVGHEDISSQDLKQIKAILEGKPDD